MAKRYIPVMALITVLTPSLSSQAQQVKASSVYATANQDGRFEIFAIDSGGALQHRWRMPGPVDWTNWVTNVDGNFTDAVVVRSVTGRLFLFALDDGALVIKSQAAPNGGWPSTSTRIGHDLRAIAASTNEDGRLEAFALGADGALYSTNATDQNATSWSEWRHLAGTGLTKLAVERDGGGRLHAVALGPGGALFDISQVVPNGGWGNWLPLEGHDLVEAKLVRSKDGSLILLAVGSDGRLYSRSLPTGATWSEWTLVSAQPFVHLSSLSVATNANGLVEVAAISTASSALHMAQRPDMSFPDNWTVLLTPNEITNFGTLSVAASSSGASLVTANDTAGQVCSIERASSTDLTDWSASAWRCFESPLQQAIVQSGMTKDQVGRPIYITQGLTGYSLVAGKSLLIRVFVPATMLGRVSSAHAAVKVFGNSGVLDKNLVVTRPALLPEGSAPLGPSVGMVVPGNVIGAGPMADFKIRLLDAADVVLQESSLGRLVFQRTKDVNVLVVFAEIGYATGMPKADAGWTNDADRAMRRLAAMLPVRDGAANSLTNASCSGLRYKIGTACVENYHPLHSPSDFAGDKTGAEYYKCVYDQTRTENDKRASGDKIDVTIEYRPGLYAPAFLPPGPTDSSPGGNSGRPPAPYSDLPRAACVSGFWGGGWMTAPCFAQEYGHNLGLEPPGSPHYQDPGDPGHSKDPSIIDPFAFDFVNRRHYATGAGDTMNNKSNGAWRGDEAVLFNSYDFEFMRSKLAAKTASTGPGSQCTQ